MDLNKKLEELKPYQLNCNVFDVYSYNGLTMQDLLCQFFTKINESVNFTNDTLQLTKWLIEEGLSEQIANYVATLIADGTIEKLINEDLFESLNNKVWHMSNMGQDVKEAMTGGSVAVVGENSVLTENICDKQVTGDKTTFLLDNNINLINPYTTEKGYLGNSGEIVEHDDYKTSDYVKIIPDNYYYSNQKTVLIFYDENKSVIKKIDGSTGDWIDVYTSNDQVIIKCLSPKNAKYVRYSFKGIGLLTHESNIFNTIGLLNIGYNEGNKFVLTDNLKECLRDYIINEIGYDALIPKNKNYITNLTKGYTALNGVFKESETYSESDFIEVMPGEKCWWNEKLMLSFYDYNKKWLRTISSEYYDYPFVIPKGVNYIKVTYRTSTNNKYLNKGEYNYGYIKPGVTIYKQLSKLNGLKWNVLGDSITSTDYVTPNWWQMISNETGIIVNNYGVSGTSISKMDTTSSAGLSFVERFESMSDDADLITVMGGTNDYKAIMGEWDSTDIKTFCGALNVLMIGLLNKYPGKRVAFFLPIQQRDYRSNSKNMNTLFNNLTSTSKLGDHELRTYIIKLKCEQYGIPYLDLFYNSGINGVDDNKVYYIDRLHPSDIAQNRMKSVIHNYIEGLF